MKIKIASIVLTGWNARKVKKTDKTVKELASSIKAVGLLQPVIVRPHPTEELKYQLAVGERRFVAHQVAGIEEIEAEVKLLTDQELRDIMLVENAEREDLSPFEEAKAIKVALEHRGPLSHDELAGVLGWTVTKVRRRSVLTNMLPELQEAMIKERVPLNACEYIAALPGEMQSQLDPEDVRYEIESLQDAKNYFGREMRDLNAVPWLLNETMGKIQACSKCPKRTGCVPDLFVDTKKEQKTENRCMDPECFKEKEKFHLDAVIKAHPDFPLYSSHWTYNGHYLNVISDMKTVGSDEKGAKKIKVVCVEGPKKGKVVEIWVAGATKAKATADAVEAKEDPAKKKPADLTKAQAKALLKEKRKARMQLAHKAAQNALRVHLCSDRKTNKGGLIDIQLISEDEHSMVGLCALLAINVSDGHYQVGKLEEGLTRFIDKALVPAGGYSSGHVHIATIMKEKILRALSSHLPEVTGEQSERRIPEAKDICTIAQLNYQDFVDAAVKEQGDEPKSWSPLKVVAGEKL